MSDTIDRMIPSEVLVSRNFTEIPQEIPFDMHPEVLGILQVIACVGLNEAVIRIDTVTYFSPICFILVDNNWLVIRATVVHLETALLQYSAHELPHIHVATIPPNEQPGHHTASLP